VTTRVTVDDRTRAREQGSATTPRMFEVRLHGRGGQGVVTAAELLSVAAFLDGREAQAFPSFGSERMGAPVMSFCRISRSRIRLREPVSTPDAVVIADATLLHQVDVFGGLRDGGFVLINSERTPHELGLDLLVQRLGETHVVTIPASELARKHFGRPLPNVCLLGAFAALTGTVTSASLDHAVRARFPASVAAANIAAAGVALALIREPSHA
jgi:pyruvate ferredoxin oxidoreductase gamma subunit